MPIKRTGLLYVLLCLFMGSTIAAKFIDSELKFVNEQFLFKPKFELTLSDKITEAINSGIAVTFVVQANLNQNIDWWFDRTISNKIQTFKLRYYSMSRLYNLHNISTDSEQNFVSLDLLLKQLSKQTEFVFTLGKNGDYIETRIFLDKQALPSTMQLPTVFDQDWNINSDWQKVMIELPDNTSNE